MERRNYEGFNPWLFMGANPTLPFHQVSSNPNFQNPTDQFQQQQNPSFASSSSQTYPMMTQILPQASEEISLESSFHRLNLNMSSNNSNHSLHQELDKANLHLQKMRVKSAVKGQRDTGSRFGPGSHSNSTSSLGSQNLVGGHMTTQPANFPSSTPINANGFNSNSGHKSRSFDELAYYFPRAPLINDNSVSADVQCWGNQNPWAVNNGLESSHQDSSSNLLSYTNNHTRPFVYYSGDQQDSTYPSSLDGLKGQVSSFAKDQNGCRMLQKEFDNKNMNGEQFDMIFSEVKDQLHDFMVHQFANYLVQKLFETGSQERRTELLLLLVSSEERFMDVCTDVHGTRAVQKFMERISTPEQRSIFLSVLKKPMVVTKLTNSAHGHHIIEHCLDKFSNEETKDLVDAIVQHCFEIATDKSGCCVLQQCLLKAKAEAKERLVAEITANAFDLSEHPYGNYVVQYVIGMNMAYVTSNLIVQLGGNFVTLAMNKYGSNVVEKCLKDGGEEDSARIITEIMHDPDFLKVLQDPFGNYVVQSALHVSKGDLCNTLVELIQHHYPFLHSHLYGKKVLARTKGRRNRV